MSMKWRSRSILLAAIALAVAAVATPALNRSWHVSTANSIMAALGILGAYYALTFLAFRCPHCRARQLRFKADWLLMEDHCWRCHQPLDGAARPAHVVEEELLAEVNPALAAEMRRDRLALEDLQLRARADPAAAMQLERELSTRVNRLKEWVSVVRRQAPHEEAGARRDLAQAEAQLAQCRLIRSHNE